MRDDFLMQEAMHPLLHACWLHRMDQSATIASGQVIHHFSWRARRAPVSQQEDSVHQRSRCRHLERVNGSEHQLVGVEREDKAMCFSFCQEGATAL